MAAKTLVMPNQTQALEGRQTKVPITKPHVVLGHNLIEPFPEKLEKMLIGLGCFWGAERRFWLQEGVFTTAVGYTGGFTPNPSYEEVCSGATGHNEVVLVVFDPIKTTFEKLLSVFWMSHNPTQGMRQGNDIGTQYRSGIYTFSDYQKQQAEQSKASYEAALTAAGFEAITTEIRNAEEFYYAEEYHQQYLAKNPNGYCGLRGTGISI